MVELSRDLIDELIDYNPETGVFTRKAIWRRGKLHKRIGRAVAGDVAGAKCDRGYIWIALPGMRVSGHRLAWFLVNGEWPDREIDHINMDKGDNRICNLRLATRTQNKQNIQKPLPNNTSGFLGVSFDKTKGKYLASIRLNGVQKNLGRFSSPEEAHERYLAAKREYHEFCTI